MIEILYFYEMNNKSNKNRKQISEYMKIKPIYIIINGPYKIFESYF